METKHERVDQLSSYGMIGNEKFVCQIVGIHEKKNGWFGNNPLNENISVLSMEIVLIFIVSRITHSLLRPCHQTMLIAQIMAGIIVGPLVLGRHSTTYEMLFPTRSRMTLATFAEFGMIIYFFKMGVQVDAKQLLKIEKRAVVIGIVGHMSSIVIGIVVFVIVNNISHLEFEEKATIRRLVFVTALTSFPGVCSFLNDMNILNSEIGRMALSTSMISDACMWVFYFVLTNGFRAIKERSLEVVLQWAVVISYFSLIFILLRPLVIWISNRNSQEKPMSEIQFLLIICIVLLLVLSSQVIGQPSFVVAYWFGLFLPDGPPLGSVLAERLDIIGSTLIVPAYCTISGLKTTTVPHSVGSTAAGVEFILLAGYIGKFAGTILPSFFFRIEFWDSFSLALIMCCKGLPDLTILNVLLNTKAINDLAFSLTIYTMVVITGFATLVIYYIYDPSRRYKTYTRKSIMDSEKDLDLKILVCVHNEDNVYPMINLLQASNPTNDTPLSVFVLHLLELASRAPSILTGNEYTNMLKASSYNQSPSQRISNVFNRFQGHNEHVTLQFVTAIAPYTSMHDDVCYMAMDTKSSIVIVPFHRQWPMDGNVEVSNASIRIMNQKVLNKAPCSIGVLIDRSQMNGNLIVVDDKSFCEIAMIFLGGADDQEALAFSVRIARHPNVRLTVFWVRVKVQAKQWNVKSPYIDLMEHVRYNGINLKGKVNFLEEIVEDGAGTTQVIRSMMEGHYSLVIVGRHHIPNSPCTLGLTEWCELPELGPTGNLLATSDFTFSVLVVQQQPFNNDFRYSR